MTLITVALPPEEAHALASAHAQIEAAGGVDESQTAFVSGLGRVAKALRVETGSCGDLEGESK